MELNQGEFYQPTPKEEAVWRVCDALHSENKRISYQSISERLLAQGQRRGSNTDLCRYLSSWKRYHYPQKNRAVKQSFTLPFVAAASAPVTQNQGALEQTLASIQETQKTILAMMMRNPESAVSAAPQPGLSVALLIDIIKKQQMRETHYLKALEHSRQVQKIMHNEMNKYKIEAIMARDELGLLLEDDLS